MKWRVKCDACEEVYEIEDADILTQTVDEERQIKRTFFRCPKCGDETTVIYITPETAKMIERRARIRARLRRKVRLTEKKIRDLIAENDELKLRIKAVSDRLKGELDA